VNAAKTRKAISLSFFDHFADNQPVEFNETRMSRFAVDLSFYFALGIAQWLLQVILVERLADPFRNFMDLCSVANISVLAMTNPLVNNSINLHKSLFRGFLLARLLHPWQIGARLFRHGHAPNEHIFAKRAGKTKKAERQ
jgi:hypothetical protein